MPQQLDAALQRGSGAAGIGAHHSFLEGVSRLVACLLLTHSKSGRKNSIAVDTDSSHVVFR